MGRSFPSKFAGSVCGACGKPIQIGELVLFPQRGSKTIQHERCPGDASFQLASTLPGAPGGMAGAAAAARPPDAPRATYGASGAKESWVSYEEARTITKPLTSSMMVGTQVQAVYTAKVSLPVYDGELARAFVQALMIVKAQLVEAMKEDR